MLELDKLELAALLNCYVIFAGMVECCITLADLLQYVHCVAKNVTTLSRYNSRHTGIDFDNFWHKCS